jgi:hypothetical protein
VHKVDEAKAHFAAIGGPKGIDANVSFNDRVETAQGEESVAAAR